MAYHNPTQGARAIHLTNGGYVLVEAGETADIDPASVRRLAPGLVKAKNKLPPVPKKLAEKLDPLADPHNVPVASEEALVEAAKPVAAFDHDGDGKPGGSKKQPDDIKALRAEYKAKLGKNPFNGWDAATLREKIGAA